jgi:pimeloyl-ACP methyl ester carboxylesterase
MRTIGETTIEICPFHVDISDEALEVLRRRIAAVRLPSRELAPSWVEKSYPNLTYFNKVDKGGHFAAWEEPELFSEEIRAAFRPLREQGATN